MGILRFLCGHGNSLTAFMDDFTNQARCQCRAIFNIHVIALVFMCCGWSINWTNTFLDPLRIPIHLGCLWDTREGTIALPEGKTTRVETWTQLLIATGSVTQEALECLVGTLVSCTPAVWQAPLRYRALQRTLLHSLRGGRGRRTVKLNDACIRDLDWWANGGLKANHFSPWRPPAPTVQIWSDASYYAGGATNYKGLYFQHPWSESERDTAHFNLLELRVARLSLCELAIPGNVVRFHLDNIMAIAYIRKLG